MSTVIAVGPYSWGRATNAPSAVRRCTAVIPWVLFSKNETTIKVFEVEDEGAYVNDLGQIVRKKGTPEPKELAPVTVLRPRGRRTA